MQRRKERWNRIGLWALTLALCTSPVFSAACDSSGTFSPLTVIRIAAEETDLYDPENGILADANRMKSGKEWIRPAYVTFTNASGDVFISQQAGLALSGGTSREYSRPSLKLVADAYEDDGWLIYSGLNRMESSRFSFVTKFKDLKLRTGGQDAAESNIRSAVMSRLCEECGFPGYLPEERAEVWLNGEFYALCSVQPRWIPSWLARRFSLEESKKIEIIGDNEHKCLQYNGLQDLFEADLNVPENREKLERQVDMTDYLTYAAIQILANNVDWPGNNFRMWRYTGRENPDNPFSDGRYRCLLYDFDLIWLFPGFLTGIFGENTFRALLDDDVMMEGIRGNFSCIDNVLHVKTYRDQFVNLLADLLHKAFLPEHVTEIMEEEAERIRESVLRCQGEAAWQQNRAAIDQMERMVADTPHRIEEDLQEYFGIRNKYTLTIRNAEGITVRMKGRLLKSGETDSAEYFLNSSTELQAEANPGFRFSGWLVNGEWREGAFLCLETADVRNGECTVETVSTPESECLIIAEVRSKGKNDWIRLLNAGSKEADLRNFRISDSENFSRAETLPDIVLGSGESLILDGKKSTEAGTYRLNLSLSEGEILCLWDTRTGNLADHLTVPRLSDEETYGFEEGSCQRVRFRNIDNVRKEAGLSGKAQ